MWFGDLVTMRWWDDLWLNESFAEWACYHAEVEATEFKDSWTGFANARKQTGYRQDQMPSTHPIAADNYDLHAVEVNFDMITYAKGASVLKQLVAWVGLDPFLEGLRQYFQDFAYGNSEFTDLLAALEKASGRELQGWATEWLQTAGVNTLTPQFSLDDEGNYSAFSVAQTAPPDWPTLRRHRIGIGLYDAVPDAAGNPRLVRRTAIETDVEGALTDVSELIGLRQPDLLLLNDEDLAYAKIRLDDRSLQTVIDGLDRLDDSLARALCWGAAWDMTRDAEMSATDFVHLVLANIGQETDSWGISRIPVYAAQAVNSFSAPTNRPALKERWERGLRALLTEAEPGSDQQLTFARTYASAAHSDIALTDLEELLDGQLAFEGLVVDQDLRWALISALARRDAPVIASTPSSRRTTPSPARNMLPQRGPVNPGRSQGRCLGRRRHAGPTPRTKRTGRSCSPSRPAIRTKSWPRMWTSTLRPQTHSGSTSAVTRHPPRWSFSSREHSRRSHFWIGSTRGSPPPKRTRGQALRAGRPRRRGPLPCRASQGRPIGAVASWCAESQVGRRRLRVDSHPA